MTGYGRADGQSDHISLVVEIRSLNSRFLEFSTRLPKTLMPFEDDALKLVKKRCCRGRITLSVKLEYLASNKETFSLNNDRLIEYMKAVEEIQNLYNRTDFPTIGELLRLPEIIIHADTDIEDKIGTKKIFIDTLENALNEMEKIRFSEGRNIEKDIVIRLNKLESKTKEINVKLEDNYGQYFNRYKNKIKDILDDVSIDENRLNQEIAILAEKKDITEEIVRLNSHYDLFKNYLNSEENIGKKLNFLLQEIGREINTIASKTDAIEISHIAVDMKDELEKIREQVQNIV